MMITPASQAANVVRDGHVLLFLYRIGLRFPCYVPGYESHHPACRRAPSERLKACFQAETVLHHLRVQPLAE